MKPWLMVLLLAACSGPAEYDGEPVFTSTPISTPTPSPTPTMTPAAISTDNNLTFSTDLAVTQGCTMTISGRDGSVEFSSACPATMDERSREFWRMVTRAYPDMKAEICR